MAYLHDGKKPVATKCHQEWTTHIYQYDGYYLERVYETQRGRGWNHTGAGSVLVEEVKHDDVYPLPPKRPKPEPVDVTSVVDKMILVRWSAHPDWTYEQVVRSLEQEARYA